MPCRTLLQVRCTATHRVTYISVAEKAPSPGSEWVTAMVCQFADADATAPQRYLLVPGRVCRAGSSSRRSGAVVLLRLRRLGSSVYGRTFPQDTHSFFCCEGTNMPRASG